MYKFFVSEEQIQNGEIKVIGDDLNHIRNVLRLKESDEILLCNRNNGVNYNTKINEINKEFIKCKIISEESGCSECNVRVDIFQGLPKFDKMEFIIQKSVELGVNNIYPLELERCIVKIDDKSKVKKIERWQKIAEVAAKQSKRDRIPEIKNIIDLEKVCKNIGNYDKIIVAYENETKNTLKDELKKLDRNKELNIGIIIGPEGGLTEEEVNKLITCGAKVVTLGKRILRTETASLVILSDIGYEFEL